MLIDTLIYSDKWNIEKTAISDKEKADLVFLFGGTDTIKTEHVFMELKELYPKANIVGASSAGNILGSEISNSPVVATAVQFEKGTVKVTMLDLTVDDNIEVASQQLISKLPQDDLKHVFLLSDGLNINGSAIIRGINSLTNRVPVTGGLAGDGDRFQETWVVANGPAKQLSMVAVGFYGDDFLVSSGCFAGWTEFGGERLITKSSGNVLYELDNMPALDFYKKNLGTYADDLATSVLRFPLSIKYRENDPEIIRTALSVSEEDKSLTFAGEVPEGYTARLMKPKVDILIDGAKMAAEEINQLTDSQGLGLVVSCTGRKVVMNELVEEELEIIEDVLGNNVQLIGFYSYGELAPFSNDIYTCQLHNQTMTLTAIYEK
ncbi:MAG: FIST C-terminal domain-containing protein [Gammaproteobacteria bacterium]|nr:FIST C-terminal domain-containing protein [Gammaproteobacteria bacterium]